MQDSLFSRHAASADWPRTLRELSDAGVTRSQVAGRSWRRTSYGRHAPAGGAQTARTQKTSAQSTTQRIIDALASVPKGGALGGWAAAFVHGVDWLDGWSLAGDALPVPVVCGTHVHRRSTSTIRYRRDRLDPLEVEERHQLPVTCGLRTAFDAARWAPDLTETVVVLDAITRTGLVTLADLGDYLTRRSGWTGVPLVRSALALADADVRSPWESRLRMVYTMEAGLPRPLVNPPVYDDRGRFVGVPDLLDVEAGLAIEYDGSGHRERVQHNQDNGREERLEDVNLIVVRVDSYDYRYQRPQLIERMRKARARGLHRDRRRDRWTLETPQWAQNPYDLLTDEDKEALYGRH
ncbi:MAG: hypothetical protein ABWX96_20060 [Propionibacteriaceae bacterium]